MAVLCKWFGHEPYRRHDGEQFVWSCRRCGEDLLGDRPLDRLKPPEDLL